MPPAATIRGTVVAWVFVRAGRFRECIFFSGMICARSVMPEPITTLSVLLRFIGIGLDKGVLSIILAHTTFSMFYVYVLVSSRLVRFDRSPEEVAPDLGCTAMEAFRPVTLPIIAPAVIGHGLRSAMPRQQANEQAVARI